MVSFGFEPSAKIGTSCQNPPLAFGASLDPLQIGAARGCIGGRPDRAAPLPSGCSCHAAHALALNSKHQMRSKKLSVLGFGQAEVQEAAAAAGQHGRSVPGLDSIADM